MTLAPNPAADCIRIENEYHADLLFIESDKENELMSTTAEKKEYLSSRVIRAIEQARKDLTSGGREVLESLRDRLIEGVQLIDGKYSDGETRCVIGELLAMRGVSDAIMTHNRFSSWPIRSMIRAVTGHHGGRWAQIRQEVAEVKAEQVKAALEDLEASGLSASVLYALQVINDTNSYDAVQRFLAGNSDRADVTGRVIGGINLILNEDKPLISKQDVA